MATHFRPLFLGGIVLIGVGTLIAQERSQRRDDGRAPAAKKDGVRDPSDAGQAPARRTLKGDQPGAQTHSAAIDRYVTSCVITENESEIALARLAQQHSTNADVKAFANQMITDHTAFLEKLRPFDKQNSTPAQGDRAKSQSSAESDDQAGGQQVPRRGENQADRGQAHPGLMVSGHAIPVRTLIQIKDEMAQKCLASAQRELQQKDRSEFDFCFMGMQVGAHMKMGDALSVVQNYVSPELQQIISQGAETAQQHLAQAKKLFEELEKKSPQSTARSKETQNK